MHKDFSDHIRSELQGARLLAPILFGFEPQHNSRKALPSRWSVDIPRRMDKNQSIDAFRALSQATRLDAFRLLVMHEPDGLPAGEIARLLEVPHNTLSSHLAILARSGLVQSERQSRSIIYRADLSQVRALVGFLLKDCCAGHPEVCAPLIDEFVPCCPPPEELSAERFFPPSVSTSEAS
jgi:ArsR family transcriptional regulator